MNVARFLVLSVCYSAVVHDAAAEELDEKYPVLASLTVPTDELPLGCKVQEIPGDGQELRGLKNYAITAETKFFVVGDERLKNLIDSKAVRACYFGIYCEKDDIGIIGWAFASEDDARKAHKALAASYAKEPERFRLWHEKKYVIWLWRDPGTTDSCFQHFEQFVKSRIEPRQMGQGKRILKKANKLTPTSLTRPLTIGRKVSVQRKRRRLPKHGPSLS